MPRPLKIILAILIIACLPLVALVVAPGFVLRPVVSISANLVGFRLEELNELAIGWDSASTGRIVLGNSEARLTFSDLALEYSLSGLTNRSLLSLTLPRLDIELSGAGASNADSDPPASLLDLLETIDSIKIDAIRVDEVAVVTGDNRFELQLAMQTQPLAIRGELQSAQLPDLNLHLEVARDRPNGLVGQLTLMASGQDSSNAALQTEFDATLGERALQLNTVSRIDLQALSAIALPGQVQWSTDSLFLSAALTLDDPLGEIALSDLRVSLDSTSPQLLWSITGPDWSGQFETNLPVILQGIPNTLNPVFEIRVPEMHNKATLVSKDLQASIAIQLSDILLSCGSLAQCFGTAALIARSDEITLDSLQAQEISVAGNFNLEYTDQYSIFTASNLAVLVASLSAPDLQSSLDLELQRVSIILDNSPRAQITYASNDIVLDIAGVKPVNPAVSGLLNIVDKQLVGRVELSLNDQLVLRSVLNHRPLDSTGRVEFTLPQLTFSDFAPLSALFDQSLVNADILAGTLEGSAELRWEPGETGSWEFEGPIDLTLDNISGFINDTFFVDLDSALTAEIVPPFILRSTDELLATLATVDVGLPVVNVRWNYGFDSANQEFHVQHFTSEILGGALEVPAFSYSLLRESNELAVVLSNMDLKSIVSLADYPQLYVDGTISGYLPVSIRNGKIIIEQGLVGTLNPGGAIRYTPLNPTPSTNPSIKLVNDALSNFQYKTMDTEVYYAENGDLNMAVRLQGLNPEMNGGQAINLNVNITDNIPSLLQSLQAGRVIEEALERSIRQR
ncbi:MAG: YdbH domain-containing protein [Proteobacteria bacterium]|nr:YdbH domain-containing protein [Pseudomonadota bacterium]